MSHAAWPDHCDALCSVPVVRATGGLADTVIDLDTAMDTKRHRLYLQRLHRRCVLGALERALDTFRDKKAWRSLQERA